MYTLFKGSDFISNDSTTNASVDLNSNELSNSLDYVSNLLGELSGWSDDQSLSVDWGSVDDLKNWNGKASGFTSTWLSLLKGWFIFNKVLVQ